jgi:DNA-binding response OmpR family regulator
MVTDALRGANSVVSCQGGSVLLLYWTAVYLAFRRGLLACWVCPCPICIHEGNQSGVPEENGFLRILLVEDEGSAAQMLAKGLREQGYAVDIAADGDAALYQAAINDYDVVLLDVMLPGRNGLAVCRSLRAMTSPVPVLMLTARDSFPDRVQGLDAGADDYLTKPFDFHELLARIRALLRRGPVLRPETIQVANLVVNTRARRVERAGCEISLTTKEYALLEYLARNAEQVVDRAQIAEHVWDETFDPFSNLIEVYVQRLRRKIDDGQSLKLLRALRGEGYMLSAGRGAK